MRQVLKVTHVFKDEVFHETHTPDGAEFKLAPAVIVKLSNNKVAVEMRLSEAESSHFREGQQYEIIFR
jgi:hypothetical protein